MSRPDEDRNCFFQGYRVNKDDQFNNHQQLLDPGRTDGHVFLLQAYNYCSGQKTYRDG